MKNISFIVKLVMLVHLASPAVKADLAFYVENNNSYPLRFVSIGIAEKGGVTRPVTLGSIAKESKTPWFYVNSSRDILLGALLYTSESKNYVALPPQTKSSVQKAIPDLWEYYAANEGFFILKIEDRKVTITIEDKIDKTDVTFHEPIWDLCLQDLKGDDVNVHGPSLSIEEEEMRMMSLKRYYDPLFLPKGNISNMKDLRVFFAGYKHGWFSTLYSDDANVGRMDAIERIVSTALGNNNDILRLRRIALEAFHMGRKASIVQISQIKR